MGTHRPTLLQYHWSGLPHEQAPPDEQLKQPQVPFIHEDPSGQTEALFEQSIGEQQPFKYV